MKSWRKGKNRKKKGEPVKGSRGIQVLCGERVLDQSHKQAGQKTARQRGRVLLLLTTVLLLKFVLSGFFWN